MDDTELCYTGARKLARMFVENFRTFESTAEPQVRAAGPRLAV